MGNTLSMTGAYIGKDDIPVDAVRQLTSGVPVFLSQAGQHVKMVIGPPWSDTTDGRYYVGTIAEFSQAKWDSATKINPPTGYSIRPQTLKKVGPDGKTFNGRPTNAYTNSMVGKCSNDAGTPSDAKSLLAVQNQCSAQDTCTGYSYNTKTGNYTLHTTDLTTGDGQVDWRCVPKSMIGVCRTEDQKEVPWSTFPGTYAECATKCMDDPKCQAYGYKGLNNSCLIHGVGPNPGNAPAGARVTSTNVNVPVWSCVVKTGRKGTPVAAAPSAASAPAAVASSTPSAPAAVPSTPPAPAPTPAPVTPTPVTPAVQVQMATPPPAPAPVMPAAPAPSVQTPAPPAGPAPVPAATSTSTSAATSSPSPSVVPIPVIPAPTPAFSGSTASTLTSASTSSPPVPSPAPSGPELNDNWMCISEFSAPVKRFGNDVGCLTLDGKTCMYDYCSKPDSKFPANPQALICGNDYKSKLGVTGYESPDGWCSKVNRVLPGATPAPLPVSAPAVEPASQTPSTTAAAAQAAALDQALLPAPAPSVTFTELGTGLCRTSGMEYPAYEQRQIGEPECLNACQQDLDCMGYAMSSDGYCQLYNGKSANVPRSAKVGDMLEKVDGNPSWKCKVKTPKVAIAGQRMDSLSSYPLTPTEANQQFDDVLLSQAANTPSAATDLPSVVGTRTGTGLSDLITPSSAASSSSALTSALTSSSATLTSALSPMQSLFQLPSMFYPSAPSSLTAAQRAPASSAPAAPALTRTPTQVLGAVTSALYAPQIQAYNACSAYFNKQSGGAKKTKAKASSKPYATAADSRVLSKAAIDHQRNVLRASLAARR